MAIMLMLAEWVQMNVQLVAHRVHTFNIVKYVCVCVFVMADDE